MEGKVRTEGWKGGREVEGGRKRKGGERENLWIVPQDSDTEEGQSGRSCKMVQEVEGGGESFLHVEADGCVHGWVKVHHHRTG